MLILPLKFVREEDKKSIGINLYHLAKLGHLGLPVIESVIAVPPPSLFENAVHKYLKNHPNIKDHLSLIRAEVLKIPIPESLKNLKSVTDFPEKTKTVMNIEKLWENLLEKWSYELLSKIERNEKNTFILTPQLIVFSANFSSLGKGYYDEERDHAVIKVEQGKIDFNVSAAIENLIIVGNKKLLLPQVYYWAIEDNKIKIIKVLPFTESLPEEKTEIEENPIPLQNEVKKTTVKTATKIFINYNSDVLTSFNFDGVFLNVKKLDPENINLDIEKILKFDANPKIIFNPDLDLNYDRSLEFAKIFLFFKNKKKHDAQIVLPETFSKDEFLNLKREMASLGIYSKGSLKLWKTFNNVADFLNLDDYLDAGFDGAVIDLDKIAKIITGVDSEIILRDLRLDWINAIEKFFKELGLSKIIKNHKQVLIKGKLIQNEELLRYFIKSGVWGLAFENNSASNLREHISILEKQTVKKLGSVEVQH